jgi:hypothetical protein
LRRPPSDAANLEENEITNAVACIDDRCYVTELREHSRVMPESIARCVLTDHIEDQVCRPESLHVLLDAAPHLFRSNAVKPIKEDEADAPGLRRVFLFARATAQRKEARIPPVHKPRRLDDRRISVNADAYCGSQRGNHFPESTADLYRDGRVEVIVKTFDFLKVGAVFANNAVMPAVEAVCA